MLLESTQNFQGSGHRESTSFRTLPKGGCTMRDIDDYNRLFVEPQYDDIDDDIPCDDDYYYEMLEAEAEAHLDDYYEDKMDEMRLQKLIAEHEAEENGGFR